MPPESVTGLTNASLAGMLFYMWYMQSRKETALQDIIKDLVGDKRLMREERGELVRMVRDHTEQSTRTLSPTRSCSTKQLRTSTTTMKKALKIIVGRSAVIRRMAQPWCGISVQLPTAVGGRSFIVPR